MNGPAVMFWAFVATTVSKSSPLGSAPICAPQMATADDRPRMSAWAFAIRARAWMLA